MKRKITITEIANSLGVAVSTVSKALNDSKEISTETKEKIRKFAVEHHYTPNEMAQKLRGKKIKLIGVIIPDILAQFFAKTLYGIEATASKLGYKLIICISNDSIEKESESLRTLVNSNIDGIILSLAKETQARQKFSHFAECEKYNIPIVLFDRISEKLKCDKITINDFEFSSKATQELYDSGCRNILYLSTLHNTSVDSQRQKGYLSIVEKERLKPNILLIKNCKDLEKELLKNFKNSPVDGILAANELSAIQAMKIISKNGYKIPEDISVIGFTNGALGENSTPTLTTVDQNAEEQGKSAVEMIIKRINEEISEPQHKIIKTYILHRESTREISKDC